MTGERGAAQRRKAIQTPEWIEWRMCGRKRAYRSEGLALEAAEWQRERALRVYRCLVCMRWHLTHKRREGM